MKNLGDPQPHGDQAATPLKSDYTTVVALDRKLLIVPPSSRRLAEINGLRTSATSHVVLMLLPALVLTRKRSCL